MCVCVSHAHGCACWLRFVLDCLGRDDDTAWLSVATVHAMKGGEAPHVVLFEFNLFGHRAHSEVEHAQDRNLLYIALTRATESLTLLLHHRTKHVLSPFLPLEMVHYARELWTSDEGGGGSGGDGGGGGDDDGSAGAAAPARSGDP